MPTFTLQQEPRVLTEVLTSFDIVFSNKILAVPNDTTIWEVPSGGAVNHRFGKTTLTLAPIVEEEEEDLPYDWERGFWDDEVVATVYPESYLIHTPQGLWLAVGPISFRGKEPCSSVCQITPKDARSMLAAFDVHWSTLTSRAEHIAESILFAFQRARKDTRAGPHRRQWEEAADWFRSVYSMTENDLDYLVEEIEEKREGLKERGYTHAHCAYAIKRIKMMSGAL